jgi:excisionase family DNA binding protein
MTKISTTGANRPAYLAPKEIAFAFRVGPSSVYRLIRNGELESFRVGGSIRVPRASVEAFVRRQLQED